MLLDAELATKRALPVLSKGKERVPCSRTLQHGACGGTLSPVRGISIVHGLPVVREGGPSPPPRGAALSVRTLPLAVGYSN
eukprot:1118622-Alexandrium_andersonii.AAC.1